LYLRTITIPDIKNLQAFLVKNRTFLSPWEPLHDDSYYSEEVILQRIEQEIMPIMCCWMRSRNSAGKTPLG
jgi:hypothetical protein